MGNRDRQTGSRLKDAALIAAVNAGVFLLFLAGDRRLWEILYYIRDFFVRGVFPGGSPAVLQADWVGYRKAAFKAFLSKDLKELDSIYGEESYLLSVYGHGLASIRFRYGILPLLVMLLLLVLTVILLWNWNQKDRFLKQCTGYLAVGYMLKMSASFILQANLVVSPYMEFPFRGMDMAEILLPILLVYEGYRRIKNEEVTIMGLHNYDHAAERS